MKKVAGLDDACSFNKTLTAVLGGFVLIKSKRN